MIIKAVQQDVFETEAKHIAFAINSEGLNNKGIASQFANKYWNEIEFCGENEIGTVLSKKIGDITLHALVCHSLDYGWGENQAEVIQECFDKIPANGDTIATVAIGAGYVEGQIPVDFGQVICGMHDSKQKILLHAGLTLEEVMKIYVKNKPFVGSLEQRKTEELNSSIEDKELVVLYNGLGEDMNDLYYDFVESVRLYYGASTVRTLCEQESKNKEKVKHPRERRKNVIEMMKKVF